MGLLHKALCDNQRRLAKKNRTFGRKPDGHNGKYKEMGKRGTRIR